MFTGLVADMGTVQSTRKSPDGMVLDVDLGDLSGPLETGFSIALSGVCCTVTRCTDGVASNRFDNLIENILLDGHVNFYFRQEVHDIFGTTVKLSVAFLPPKTLDLGNRDSLYADRGQGLTYLVKLERLDYCTHEFHVVSSSLFLKSGVRPGIKDARRSNCGTTRITPNQRQIFRRLRATIYL